MTKISKQNIVDNKHNCILIMAYSIIISIVYDAWVYYTINWLWLLIVLPIVVCSTGFVLMYLSTVKKMKQNETIIDEKAKDK